MRDAATRGDVDAVTRMLSDGVLADVADDYGDTALHKCATYGHRRCAATLVSAMADLNAIGWCGRTPLHEAATNGQTRVAEDLLLAGCNPRIEDNDGKTARDCAERSRHADIVRLLDAHCATDKPEAPSEQPQPQPEPEPEPEPEPAGEERTSTPEAAAVLNHANWRFLTIFCRSISSEFLLKTASLCRDAGSTGGVPTQSMVGWRRSSGAGHHSFRR